MGLIALPPNDAGPPLDAAAATAAAAAAASLDMTVLGVEEAMDEEVEIEGDLLVLRVLLLFIGRPFVDGIFRARGVDVLTSEGERGIREEEGEEDDVGARVVPADGDVGESPGRCGRKG